MARGSQIGYQNLKMIWKNILWVAFGGSLGAVSRYLIYKYLSTQFPMSFPIGTFAINIAGCFLIGLFLGLSLKSPEMTPEMKLFLMTGFCGGFTTFSSFTAEGMTLIQQDKILVFLLYTGLSIFIGLSATFLGYWLTR